MTITELREKRNKAWEAAKAFVDTRRDKDGLLTAEDAATYAQMEQKVKDYSSEIDRMERQEAILEAGMTRMRPILMTTVTTILGLFDMAVRKSAGTALMQPIAVVCIGGLVYATLMTLFVVPCIYDLLNKKELRNIREEDLKLLDL